MRNSVRKITVQFAAQNEKLLENLKAGFKGMGGELEKTNKTLNGFQGSLRNLQGLLGATAFGFGARELVNIADSMQKLNDRLVNTEGTTEKAAETLGKLRDIANQTNSSIEDLATIYARLNLSLAETGISTDALLGLTLALQNSFRLSGATASEATASVIQLSQGLASGQLRGQELRSVLEQNAVAGGILAKQLGITRGQLLKFAEKEGGIKASDVIKAFANNFDALEASAARLQPTIGEALTKSFNNMKVSLNETNKELGISLGIVKAIEIAFDNLGKVTLTLAAAIIYLKREAIGVAFVTALATIKGTLASLGTTIIITATAIGAVPLAIGAAVTAVIGAIAYFTDFKKVFSDFKMELTEFRLADLGDLAEFLEKFDGGLLSSRLKDFIAGVRDIKSSSDLNGTFIQRLPEQLNFTTEALITGRPALSVYGAALQYAASQMKDAVKAAIPLKKQLENLNAGFNEGKIDVVTYNTELLRLTDLLNNTKGPQAKFEALSKVVEGNLQRSLEYGLITLQEYNVAIEAFNISKLEEGFAKGYISAEDFHSKVIEISSEFRPDSAIFTGVNNYMNSIGNLSTNVAGAVERTFSSLEDTMLDFIMTGKASFKQFAYDIISDINRIILRAMVIRPLAEGILGAINPASVSGSTISSGGSGFANTPSAGFAKGGAFDNGIQFFANGGIVNRATSFGMANGKTGVMGEAGAEAILPLSRGSGGKLGVRAETTPVVINVINNSDSQVTQSESTGPNGEKQIQLLIQSTVRDGISSGNFDKALRSSFNLTRRGN